MKICKNWASSFLENFWSGHGSLCFVLVFVGYPGDSLHSVCSAGFSFQVHFWAAISCAEHGSQNCPKLIDWGGPMAQSQLGNLRQPWYVSAPESCTCSSSFLVPWLCSTSRLLQTPVFWLWLFVKTQEKLRCPYWAKVCLLLYLNAFVTSEHDEDVTHHTRVAVVEGVLSCCPHTGLMHLVRTECCDSQKNSIWFFRDLHRWNLKRLLG